MVEPIQNCIHNPFFLFSYFFSPLMFFFWKQLFNVLP